MKKKLIWTVVNMCRMAVAATFIISGLVKLIDPRGTEYKIHDYLMAMNLEGVMMHEVAGVRGGDLQRLRAWVFAKLLWDTSLDEDELAREYCRNVYGDGAESMFEYYRLVNEPCRKGGQTIEQYHGIGTFLKRERKSLVS